MVGTAKYYWGIKVPKSICEKEEIYLHADSVEIIDENLVFKKGDLITFSLSKGNWNVVYAELIMLNIGKVKFMKKNSEIKEIADKYKYDDPFKEDLIHQLWHLVEEIKTLHEKLEYSSDKIEYLSETIDGLSTEFYKYRKDLDQVTVLPD